MKDTLKTSIIKCMDELKKQLYSPNEEKKALSTCVVLERLLKEFRKETVR